ncbi:MAG: hypothetical protein DCC67_09160 [Planctomycetota bacterium]|nr:MAG: hypothetical protein DCC67_09160 [Planctomycetota bacterium]
MGRVRWKVAACVVLAASAGCAVVGKLLRLTAAECQHNAIERAAARSPNEQIQAQAAEARRQVDSAPVQ